MDNVRVASQTIAPAAASGLVRILSSLIAGQMSDACLLPPDERKKVMENPAAFFQGDVSEDDDGEVDNEDDDLAQTDQAPSTNGANRATGLQAAAPPPSTNGPDGSPEPGAHAQENGRRGPSPHGENGRNGVNKPITNGKNRLLQPRSGSRF